RQYGHDVVHHGLAHRAYSAFNGGLNSMQPWRLQQLRPIGRAQHHVESDALVVDRERHVDAGGAERPELAIEAGLAGNLVAVDREDDIARLEFGARCRSLAGDADYHDAVVDFGGVHAEPRPRRLVDAAEFPDVVEHRLQQVDRYDHVDVFGLALALAFELQRTDADQFAAVRDQPGAAPIGMRGMGEDGLIQQIFPIAGKFL